MPPARFHRKIAHCFLTLTTFLCACHKDHKVTPATAINPLSKQTYDLNVSYGNDPNHTVTVYLTVYINGTAVQVAFDTGSSGLRIVQGALGNTQIQTTTQPISYGYGDGTKTDNLGINGVLANVDFSLDPNVKATNIPIMLIQSAEIDSMAWFSTTTATTLGGAYRGKSGLLGVGFRLKSNSYGIGSPLAQLAGGGRFIVSLPHFAPGVNMKGKLIINPDSMDVNGFQPMKKLPQMPYQLPNGYYAFHDDSLSGNAWINGVSYPQHTLLDIGNPLTWVHNPKLKSRDFIGADTVVRLQVGDPVIADTTFTVHQQASGLDWIETNSGLPENSFGIQFFFEYDVLFDPQNGVISLRKKP